MKMNYSKPAVQAIDMIPACSLMQVVSNVPSWSGSTIEDGGDQSGAR